MRAEIDALVAHAYGLTEDEIRFIFTDFTENAVSPPTGGRCWRSSRVCRQKQCDMSLFRSTVLHRRL